MKKQYKYTFFILALFSFNNEFTFSQGTLEADTTKNSTSRDTIIYKNSQQVDNLINYAKKFLGTPYRSAGTTPSGFDCSGFISYIFGNFGFDLVHSSYGMAEYGTTVKLADIRPGDLMFFKGRSTSSSRVGHVAMVVDVKPDGIYFIHSSTSQGVIINNFKTSKYYIPRYITTKRLDYGETLKK
jgi:cell wall-associated NlpC family hydrolase